MSRFNAVVKKSELNLLAEGTHLVKVNEIKSLDSFHNDLQGTLKEGMDYANPVPQIACVLVGKDGVHTFRWNGEGNIHTEEVTPEMEEVAEIIDIEGIAACSYGDLKKILGAKIKGCDAVDLDPDIVKQYGISDEDIVRIPSAKRIQSCNNIISQNLAAFGVAEGTAIPEALETIVTNGYTVNVTIAKERYDGQDKLKVKGFKAVAEEVEEEEADKDKF